VRRQYARKEHIGKSLVFLSVCHPEIAPVFAEVQTQLAGIQERHFSNAASYHIFVAPPWKEK
jgi:hypothetical protein